MRGFTPFALAVVAGLLIPAVAPAQQRPGAEPKQPAVEIPADGSELFRALLDRAGVKPVTYRDMRNLWTFDDVMVVILGPVDRFNAQVHDLPELALRARMNGGAVLFATGGQTQLANRWQHDPVRGGRWVSASVDWGRVQNDSRDSILTGFEECPFVVPLTRDAHRSAPDAESPLAGIFKGLTRVATFCPAPLRATGFGGEFRHALAAYPDKSYLADERGNFQGWLQPDLLFAVGGVGPDEHIGRPYRFLAMADHHLFLNRLLIEPGTQNLELTYRVMDFLGGPNPRKRCLFVENGRVVEKFDGLRQAFAKQKPPLPMPNLGAMQEKLVDLGNQIADKVQSEDVPFKLVDRATSVPGLVRVFLLVATVYGAWFLMRRMFSARKPTDAPPAPAVAGVPTGPPGVFDRRQKELVRRNNVYEPVRDMVREFFTSIGIHGPHNRIMPKLVISDAVRKPDSLRLAVRDFWMLAYGKPQEVTVSRWRELEPYFDRVRKAHADGKWRFVLDTETAGSTA